MKLEHNASVSGATRTRKRHWLRGLLLGALTGLGAVAITPAVGLPRRRRALARRTQAMTVALCALGGLLAGAVASYLDRGMRAASTRHARLLASGRGDESWTGESWASRMPQASDLDVIGSAM